MLINANHNVTTKIQPQAQIVSKKKGYKLKNKKVENPNEKQTDNLVSAQLERRRSGKVKDLLDEDASNLVSKALNRRRAEHKESNYIKKTAILLNNFMNPKELSIKEAFGWCKISGSDEEIIRVPQGYELEIREDGWWRLIKGEPEQKQHLGLLACIFVALIVFFSIYAYYHEPKEINHADLTKMLHRIRH